MEFNFILNGKDVSVNCRPDAQLSTVLREHFDLLKVKNGCNEGQCGSCSIIYNGKLIAACLLPAFCLKDSEIMTDEGFTKLTERQEINKVIRKFDVDLCDYCKSGRMLAIHYFLDHSPTNRIATEKEILNALSGNRCNCIDPWTLVQIVQECQKNRQRKLHVFRK